MTKSNAQVAAETKAFDPKQFGTPEELYKTHGSWSKVFRFLKSKGLSNGQIAKVTGKLYQHVRNVLITPVGKKAGA